MQFSKSKSNPIFSIILLIATFLNLHYVYASPVWRNGLNLQNTTLSESQDLIDVLKARADVTNSKLPTLAAFTAKIAYDGPWASRTASFYTGLQSGSTLGSAWYDNRPKEFPKVKEICSETTCALTCGMFGTKKVASYLFYKDCLGDKATTDAWMDEMTAPIDNEALANGQKAQQTGKAFDGTWRGAPVDVMQTRISQALAEAASGDVYLFTPADSEPLKSSTWYGWEYPALTRNSNVDNIYRVDPTDLSNDPVRIWKKGDGPTTREPRGSEDPLQPGVRYDSTTASTVYTNTASDDPTGPV